jgi:hypothetical protein
MTGDVTNNHTRITPPIDLISSTDGPDSFESALPPVLDTTFDSSFLDNLDIPRPIEPDYWDSFFNATTSQIIYHSFLDSCLEYNISASDIHDSVVAPRHTIASDIDFKSKRKYFSYLPIDVIKATFKYTSQCMKLPPSTHLQKRFWSPNPGANMRRRYEDDSTDLIYSTVPSISGKQTHAHTFCGCTTKITDVYRAKDDTAATFLACFQDRVRSRGAPTRLIADNAPMYRGWRVTRYLRDTWTSLWQAEAKYQHQNYAENRYQLVKRYTNKVMDRSGCPSNLWFYAMCYVIFCLNHSIDLNLCDGTKTPFTLASGLISDISPLHAFYFYQPVYFHLDSADQTHPHSTERRGRWLGISEHIGHAMTFLILTDDTQEIISRSILRPADDLDRPQSERTTPSFVYFRDDGEHNQMRTCSRIDESARCYTGKEQRPHQIQDSI